MEKFCELSLHEYMDEYPQKKVRTFVGNSLAEIEKNARDFCKKMSECYSGGPTTFIKVMTSEEAKKHIEDLVAYEKKHWQDDSLEFINNVTNLYKKCYEEE